MSATSAHEPSGPLEPPQLNGGDGSEGTIVNTFDPHDPVLIHIRSDVWSSEWHDVEHYIDWRAIALPQSLLRGIRDMLRPRLRCDLCVRALTRYRNTLKALEKLFPTTASDFGDIGLGDWTLIWSSLNPDHRSCIRELYRRAAASGQLGADPALAIELSRWKARRHLRTLKHVLAWHPEFGALTLAEETSLRDWSGADQDYERDQHQGAWLLVRILQETLRRPSQVLRIRSDGLRQVGSGAAGEWYLVVPPAKRQTGRPPELVLISTGSAHAIQGFCERPRVHALQQERDRLIVWDTPTGKLNSRTAGSAIRDLVASQGIISARTDEALHVTPNRLRHTGGTRLAAKGASREVIAVILEQDSFESADAYIDAVASDLCPVLDRADRELGGIFSALSAIYFKGSISDTVGEQAIFVPRPPKPGECACLVGACSRNTVTEGKCSRHPFHACFNGCAKFVAWREASHFVALAYVDDEISRWRSAAGHPERFKALKELESTRKAILEVVARIDQERLASATQKPDPLATGHS
jgi:hypothetical protein